MNSEGIVCLPLQRSVLDRTWEVYRSGRSVLNDVKSVRLSRAFRLHGTQAEPPSATCVPCPFSKGDAAQCRHRRDVVTCAQRGSASPETVCHTMISIHHSVCKGWTQTKQFYICEVMLKCCLNIETLRQNNLSDK